MERAEIDTHRIWRDVEDVAQHLNSMPREGYDVVVEVFLPGREPLGVAAVGTRHLPGDDWVKIYTGDDDQSYVFVRESHILRIEVTYEPAGKFATGFSVVEEADDD